MLVTIELNTDEMLIAVGSGALEHLTNAIKEGSKEVTIGFDTKKSKAVAPVNLPEAIETTTEAQPVPTVQTVESAYTLDEIAIAATALMDMGKIAELQDLLASYDVQSLPELAKEHYNSFVFNLREMGADI